MTVRVARALLLCALAAGLVCDSPLPRPGEVVLVGPADGAKTADPAVDFSWQAVGGAVSYRFQLASDDGFDNILVDDVVDSTGARQRLETDGLCRWRVGAIGEDSVAGEWSEARELTLERYRVLASAATPGYGQDIWAGNGYALIADGQAGLAVLSTDDPGHPRYLFSLMDSVNEAFGVVGRPEGPAAPAYVAYGYKELLIAAWDPESTPGTIGELEYPQPGTGLDIDYADSSVYIAADAQFIIVDVSAPQFPNLTFQYHYPRGCRGVALADSLCVLALEQLGIDIWNVATTPPGHLGSLNTPSNARSVAAADGYLYIGDGRGGLIVADISDPSAPVATATLDLGAYANRVSVTDTVVYVGCGDDGVAAVSVADPTAPRLLAFIPTSYARGAVEFDGYLYVCDRDSGLVVVEIAE